MTHRSSTASLTTCSLSDLQSLCEELGRRGWEVHLVWWRLWEDVDVRLQVGGRDGAVVVEVLGPYPAVPEPDRWLAVQLRFGRRVVWSGPARNSDGPDVVRFVEDLLLADPGHLAQCYRPLG